jgi:hypothetical protein
MTPDERASFHLWSFSFVLAILDRCGKAKGPGFSPGPSHF